MVKLLHTKICVLIQLVEKLYNLQVCLCVSMSKIEISEKNVIKAPAFSLEKEWGNVLQLRKDFHQIHYQFPPQRFVHIQCILKISSTLSSHHLEINSWWSWAMFLFWHIKQTEDICLNLRHPFGSLYIWANREIWTISKPWKKES